MINYIRKLPNNKLLISTDIEDIIKEIPIQKQFNLLLKKQLTNLKTREKQTKINLNFKSKVPIYIDKNNLYLCMKSYRLDDSFYINYHSIISYTYSYDFIKVNFKSNQSIKIKGKLTFKSQLKKCADIIQFLT